MLGPILLLVYINDLPDELSSQVRLFADDTAVYLTIGGADDGKVLQNDLDRLSVWKDRWDMEFNPSKCQVVQVTSSKNFIKVIVNTTNKHVGSPCLNVPYSVLKGHYVTVLYQMKDKRLKFMQNNVVL